MIDRLALLRAINEGFDWRDPVEVEWRFQLLRHRGIIWG